MNSDLVADMLTRIRNAQKAGHASVKVRKSSLAAGVLEVLKREGFIEGIGEAKDAAGFPAIDVVLKYYGPKEPMISRLDKISTSGRRIYKSCSGLLPISRGLGIAVLSTSQGVMSDREARRKKIGGEVLAVVS